MKGYRLIKMLIIGMALVMFMVGHGWSYSITLSYDSWWGTDSSTDSTIDGPLVVATSADSGSTFFMQEQSSSVKGISEELTEGAAAGPTEGSNGYIENGTGDFNDAPAPVPEPSTLILLGAGLIGAAMLRKRMS